MAKTSKYAEKVYKQEKEKRKKDLEKEQEAMEKAQKYKGLKKEKKVVRQLIRKMDQEDEVTNQVEQEYVSTQRRLRAKMQDSLRSGWPKSIKEAEKDYYQHEVYRQLEAKQTEERGGDNDGR